MNRRVPHFQRHVRIHSVWCVLETRKYYCTKCKVTLSSGYRHGHVAFNHLGVGQLALSCKMCSYQTKWSTQDIDRHFERAHPGHSADFIDKRKEFKQLIDKIVQELIVLVE